jgi:hypothetical protein
MSTNLQERSDVMDTLHVRLPAWPRTELERGAGANERTVSHEVRSRAAALRMSRENIDRVAGWADRRANKLLSPNPTKRLGVQAMEPMMDALGMKLLAVEDPETLERHRHQREIWNESQVRTCSWLTWGDPVV